jgi:hypothetical protein
VLLLKEEQESAAAVDVEDYQKSFALD